MTKSCVVCGTRPAVLKRGTQVVCVECFGEPPLLPVAHWDTLIRPEHLAKLERRLAAVEQIIAEWTGGQ